MFSTGSQVALWHVSKIIAQVQTDAALFPAEALPLDQPHLPPILVALSDYVFYIPNPVLVVFI